MPGGYLPGIVFIDVYSNMWYTALTLSAKGLDVYGDAALHSVCSMQGLIRDGDCMEQ